MQIEELLEAYVNNEKINMDINDSDIKLLIEQSLQTLLYPVTQNKEYKKYYISWVLKQEQFYNLQTELTNLFNDNNINHIYFKGSVLSKLYDDPSVRTRGDIDLYVNPKDLDKTKNLLLSNGYKLDPNDCMHHIGFIKNNIEVEVHFNMFDSDCNSKWLKLFENPFDHTVNVDQSLYEFTPTYHLTYCIMHFADHLRQGAGLRYVLDFYYMFKKSEIDFNLLRNILKECNLSRLYSNIINAIRQIFDINFDKTITKEDVTFFIDYLKLYGIHGNSNNETSMNASRHKNKFKYALQRIFITDNNYRIMRFPRMGKHWYLYPICLICHWCYLLTHKLGAFFKLIFGKNNNKKLYKKLGI